MTEQLILTSDIEEMWQRRTAIHEAGHVVVAELLGFIPTAATVVGGNGRTYSSAPAAETSDQWVDRVALAVAGIEALRLDGDPAPDLSASHDIADARDTAQDGSDQCGRTAAAIFSDATWRAANVLGEHWPAVTLFAAELRLSYRLAGDDFDAALTRALGGRVTTQAALDKYKRPAGSPATLPITPVASAGAILPPLVWQYQSLPSVDQ